MTGEQEPRPELVVMVGLQGSGKSTFVEHRLSVPVRAVFVDTPFAGNLPDLEHRRPRRARPTVLDVDRTCAESTQRTQAGPR